MNEERTCPLLSDLMEMGLTSGYAHGRRTLAAVGRDGPPMVCAMGYAGVGYGMHMGHTVDPDPDLFEYRRVVNWYDRMVFDLLDAYGYQPSGRYPGIQYTCPDCGVVFPDTILGRVVHLNDIHKAGMPRIIDEVRRHEVGLGLREVLDVTQPVTMSDYSMVTEEVHHG